MARYVDGYVIPIKKKNVRAYKKMAEIGCKAWMKYGALNYYECVGNDFIKHGMSFKKLCKLKSDETVVFAFVVFKSKAHRNQVNKKVMKEFHAMGGDHEMPFDMKRFSYAGFNVIVRSK